MNLLPDTFPAVTAEGAAIIAFGEPYQRGFAYDVVFGHEPEEARVGQVDGIVGMEGEGIAALVTYTIEGDTCEITSLNSLKEGMGIGSFLIERVLETARREHCRRVVVVTTNDNIGAIRFYQRRGFDMARFYHNALDVSRRLKPEIPLIGEDGIPLRHEIEFEYSL